MNPRVLSKGMYLSSNICLDGCPAEHLSALQRDRMPANSGGSGVSVTLRKDDENMNMQPESSFYSSGDATSSLVCSSKAEPDPTRDSTTKRHRPPSSRTCGHQDWNLSGRQAKRARVENIIKGMASSPAMHCTEVATHQHKDRGCVQENESIQELPIRQEHMERCAFDSASPIQTTREQSESQHQQVRTRFKAVDEVSKTTDSTKEEKYPTCSNSPDTSPRDAVRDSYSGFESGSTEKYQGWKKVKLLNYFQTRPERVKLMADVLKYELSRAVSKSVDYIFKSMPLLQASPNREGSVETDISLQSPGCKDNKCRLSYCEKAVPDVQTEALSLVVQKPQLETSNKFIFQSSSTAQPHLEPPVAFDFDSAQREDRLSERSQSTVHQHALRCLQDEDSEVGQPKSDTHWNSVKVRSKVNSRSVRSPQVPIVSLDPVLLENLCLPHVKIEAESLVKNNLYMLNEGLTTNHLKKAKLMFFYTRYPSSLVLKICFHDVKFTRCITTQLIKWFSNFREFYYIQMEKFARHALIEGVDDVRGLTVGRESELFRALNMHYNKTNDFQVPDRFIEVAEITLKEFYVAISLGKDRDPSWKKAIYKVICKLDSEVPAEFKCHHSE